MKKLQLKKHLSIDELKKKRAECKDGRTAIKWTVLIIMQEDNLSANAVAKRLKLNYEVVRQTIKKYNELGIDGLIDKRKNNKRGDTKKTAEIFDEINQILSNPPIDAGIWTGKKLKKWVEKRFNIKVSLPTIYVWMRELNYSAKKNKI